MISPSVTEADGSPLRFGRYEVVDWLSCGGVGVVYLARLQGPGGFERLAAIKVLHEHLATRGDIVTMLLDEARLVAQIQHPNVVSTLEVGVTDNGSHYLVMEYVEGVSLDDLLEHPKLDAITRMRVGMAALLDAMAGLDAAQRARDVMTGEPLCIVHRDVSVGNVLLGIDGVGRIADFGIARAKLNGASPQEPSLLCGTPSYMSPEQVNGAAPDARTDVFALGALLWEVLTGEQLFDSPDGPAATLQQVLSSHVPPPSERNSWVPPELDAICLQALERDLSLRYGSVGEMRAALSALVARHQMQATPEEVAHVLSALFGESLQGRRERISYAMQRSSQSRISAATTLVSSVQLEETDTSADPSLQTTQIGVTAARGAAQTTAPPVGGGDARPGRIRAWQRWALLGAVSMGALWALGRLAGEVHGDDDHGVAQTPAPSLPATSELLMYELTGSGLTDSARTTAATTTKRQGRSPARNRRARVRDHRGRAATASAVPASAARSPQRQAVTAAAEDESELTLELNPYVAQP